jgi:hypothetical protein
MNYPRLDKTQETEADEKDYLGSPFEGEIGRSIWRI